MEGAEVRLLDRSPLLVLHGLGRSIEYAADPTPHIIGLVDGRMVVQMPNGASLLPLTTASLRLRGMSRDAGFGEHDYLLRSRVRTPAELELGDSLDDPSPARGHVIARSRLWEIRMGWQVPGSFFVESDLGSQELQQPLELSALRLSMAHTLTKSEASRWAPWRGGRSNCLGWATRGERERQAGAVLLELARQAGVEAAAARIRTLRKRAAVAASVANAIWALPPSITNLISSTWWNPYLRPKTWAPTLREERLARKEARRRRTGRQPVQGMPRAAGAPPGEVQKGEDAEFQAQLQMQAFQLQTQLEAEAQDRAQRQAQAKELRMQQLLQSAVRSTLFYLLRAPQMEDDVPLMRLAGLTPLDELRPARARETPQGEFFAGLPDAVQEMFPQIPVELCSLAEGPKKPSTALARADGKSRKPLTAQVTRIRGSSTSAYTFASLLGGGRFGGGGTGGGGGGSGRNGGTSSIGGTGNGSTGGTGGAGAPADSGASFAERRGLGAPTAVPATSPVPLSSLAVLMPGLMHVPATEFAE
mmetsp:Transcript_12527/g.40228  ORF Transcript_12527/g.40228 Transcript_12527/m.40228 type:complete len:532 (+) Transcript_12527:188-1783(+)